VIAAVNGDFFAIEGDYHPSGLAIKNGQKLNSRQVGGKPFTGVTKEGEYILQPLFFSSDDTSNILNAISGNYAIVFNGKPYMTAMDTEMGYTSHPRTLAGLTEDGKLILAVIDGRQSSLSNGADLEKAAYFMISLGAVKAINHDGGGSSTMILRTQGTYRVMNSPSDGSLRKVFGSIQIVLKSEPQTGTEE
jgi:exopolysaccharide biosynthesis protein